MNILFSSKRTKQEFANLNNSLKLYLKNILNNKDLILNKGIKIQKRLWPKEFIKQFNITNLYKLNLPFAYRIVYTIKTDKSGQFVIIFAILNHKSYERLFKY